MWLQIVLHYFEAGNGYQFWSGIGSDLSEFTGPALGVLAYAHHHNCHEPGCWSIRTAIHPEHGWRVCKRHYHADPPHVRHAIAQLSS